MSGFQFPPPPPPPPKASWTSDSQFQQSQILGRGRGRGRGRARGSDSGGRGRGGRGGHGTIQSHQTAPNPPRQQQQVAPFSGLPPGAYINPAFQGNLNLPNFETSIPNHATQSPARTFAGHKRKLDALRGPSPPETKAKTAGSPTAPAVPSFGGLIGLNKTVSLPTHPTQTVQHAPQSRRSTNVLGLTPNGEPQYSSSGSDDEDEDIDEEAMFAEVGSSLTFEHNGSVLSLNSAADLAAWKKERARNYPTQTRTAAKLEEKRKLGGERRRLLFGASKALRIARMPAAIVPPPDSRLETARKELAVQAKSLDALRKRVAKSEARVALPKANVGDVRDPKALTQAETMDLATALPLAGGCAPASQDRPQQQGNISIKFEECKTPNEDEDHDTAECSSSESSIISSDSSDSESDSPPEEASSKQSKEVPGTKRILCRDYVASGRCRDGDSCRFRHELPERGTGTAYRENAQREQQERERRQKAENDLHDAKLMEIRATDRKTIFQRLVEQEHVGEDLLALQVIKVLGKMNFFAENSVEDEEEQDNRR